MLNGSLSLLQHLSAPKAESANHVQFLAERGRVALVYVAQWVPDIEKREGMLRGPKVKGL